MTHTTRRKSYIAATILTGALMVVTILAHGTGEEEALSFTDLIADRQPMIEALYNAPQARPKSGEVGGTFTATVDDGETSTTTHIDGTARFAMMRRLHAVDLTRFFAEKYGLDPEEPMPAELADEYDKFVNDEVDTETYLATLELWINRKPRWLAGS